MVKRLISANASEITSMSKETLLQSIKACEGRVVLSENIVTDQPIIHDVTNAEIARAHGADLVLLNKFDVYQCFIEGMPEHLNSNQNVIKSLKKLIGCPVGLNLEPVDIDADMVESRHAIANGRIATEHNLELASKLGFDFVTFTGNPSTGVSNDKIKEAVKMAKTSFDGLVFAGKMHGSGVKEPVVDLDLVKALIKHEADVILVPAVGTVYGVNDQMIDEVVQLAHYHDRQVMSTIGTSQESSDPATVREIAIRNKILGIDMQHIGDAGYGGLAPASNIMALSIAIRGERHTISRMSRSIMR
ncbi:hypothetical protein [Staphylococcus massiliensis]|uniref:DUF7916 family protein n=1 Tax=Staphylococcus massiliensis TaxID=555791 RepID=UPI0002F3DA6C|nr:hypothetical protein [Staphylococcus massiliensis]MCG3399310.1 haloacid dehalogenase-like hydrolase [Staphylococcus massiliensis]MCG3411653.1 haloacid dehalogenase-like hydrolase [Staphylococcus massiliensis]PNZ98596.1 PEP phosphonomutase [Staphylococcus massiliensis CCUG 55927]